MITASAAYNAANAALSKEPVWLIEIAGYYRAFTNKPLAISGLSSPVPSLGLNPAIQHAERFQDFGGFTSFPGDVTLQKATPAGNLLFAFLGHGDGIGFATTISDSAGNVWTNLSHLSDRDLWYCVAVAWPAGNVVTWDVPGATRGNAQFLVIEVAAAYSGFTWASLTGAFNANNQAVLTVGANTMIVGGTGVGNSYYSYMIALASPTGVFNGISIAWFVSAFQSAASLAPAVAVPPGPATVPAGHFVDLIYGDQTAIFDWLVSIDNLKETVSDLDGSSDLSDLVFNVQDRTQQITQDMASFVFEGKECRLYEGFVGMSLVDFLLRYRGVMNTVASDNGNGEYRFTASNYNLKKLSAKIYTQSDPDVNGNTFTVDSNHPRSINGHPLDIFVSALQQAGVALSDIDTAKIYYYRDFIFNGLQIIFKLTDAPTAKDFIENELMKVMGMYYRENNLGVVSANSFYPAIFPFGGYTPAAPPAAIWDIDNTLLIPLAGEADLINQVISKFDDDGSGSKFLAENIADFDLSISKYGLVDGHTIESQGLKSAFQGYFHAQLISFLIFLRYGLKNLVIDGLPALWSESLLEPGDIIALTEPFVPDRAAGAMGVASKYFEVMDRTWDFESGKVELRLLAIDLSRFTQYLITPNGEADYAADTALNQSKYMYLCDSAGQYSNGDPGNTLG